MTVDEIAQIVRGKVRGKGQTDLRGEAQLESASASDLTYAEGSRALTRATASGAGCILVKNSSALPHHTTIETSHPKLAFIQAAEALRPTPPPPSGIHPTAVLAPNVVLHKDVYAGPHVVIENGVRV